MRILVNGWFWGQATTGSGQYLAALAEHLARLDRGHEFILARPDFAAEGPPLPEGWGEARLGAPVRRLGENFAKLWFEQVTFPRACGRLGADVAFVPYWGSPWRAPCPVVVTVHDLIPLLLPLYRGGPLQRGYTALVGRTARRAAAVLTDSEASRGDIIRNLRIHADRVHAISLACAPETWAGEDEAAVRARLGLPGGMFLLYLGGFDVRKNVPRTLEAYAQLVRRMTAEGREPPFLVIAGGLPTADTPFTPDPRRVARELGLTERIVFTGRVDEAEKVALHRMATAALFLSEYEGFGLPALEAMAFAAQRADEHSQKQSDGDA
ncbi:MAG: glycosyltransferase family 4 protein [Anaerolineae bacterium]|nr:glycosyltransferase family 4 protein [Anaerolineae bacterium]